MKAFQHKSLVGEILSGESLASHLSLDDARADAASNDEEKDDCKGEDSDQEAPPRVARARRRVAQIGDFAVQSPIEIEVVNGWPRPVHAQHWRSVRM